MLSYREKEKIKKKKQYDFYLTTESESESESESKTPNQNSEILNFKKEKEDLTTRPIMKSTKKFQPKSSL